MNHQKYKYLGSPREKEPEPYPNSPRKYRPGSPHQSPRHRHQPPPFRRQDYFVQQLREGNFSPLSRQTPGSGLTSNEGRMKNLINEVLNSADSVAKELLSYGNSQAENLCSHYYLSRQKLTTFLTSDKNNPLQRVNSKISKKYTERKQKYREDGSDEMAEEFAANQLGRLEDIVYGKVIPILQTDFDIEYKKSKIKTPREQKQTDLHEGMALLQKMQQRRNNVDMGQYVQVLQKFVRRVMDKEEVLMNKLIKLQEKLQLEMQKSEQLSKDKRREAKSDHKEGVTGRQLKNLSTYANFVHEIKIMTKDSTKKKSTSDESLRIELDLLASRVRNLINNSEGSQRSKCSHKAEKQLHAHCKQERVKNQEQIKKLKEIVKNLDKEVEALHQECQNLQSKVISSTDKLSKFQNRSSKIVQQNEELNAKVDLLTSDNTYKNHLIGEYLNIINKLQDHIKIKQQNFSFLQTENREYIQNIEKKNEGYQKLLQHVSQIEDRNKELEQGQDRKDRQLQQALQHLYIKQFEATRLACDNQKLQKQIEKLKGIIRDGNQKGEGSFQIRQLLGKESIERSHLGIRSMDSKRNTEDVETQTDFQFYSPSFARLDQQNIQATMPQNMKKQIGMDIANEFNPIANPFNLPHDSTGSQKKNIEEGDVQSLKKQIGKKIEGQFKSIPNPFNVPQQMNESLKKKLEQYLQKHLPKHVIQIASGPHKIDEETAQKAKQKFQKHVPKYVQEIINGPHKLDEQGQKKAKQKFEKHIPKHLLQSFKGTQQLTWSGHQKLYESINKHIPMHVTRSFYIIGSPMKQQQSIEQDLPQNFQQNIPTFIEQNRPPSFEAIPSNYKKNRPQNLIPNPFNLQHRQSSQEPKTEPEPKKEEEHKNEEQKKEPIKHDEPKKEEPVPTKEEDIEVLQQTINLMEAGLKHAQQQIQKLTNHNKILLAKNQELFRATQVQPSLQATANFGLPAVPVDDYKSHEDDNNAEKHQRPDYIPSRINKIIQKAFKELERGNQQVEPHSLGQEINQLKKGEEENQEEKKEDYDSEEQERKKRRSDWDHGHKAPLDDQIIPDEENPEGKPENKEQPRYQFEQSVQQYIEKGQNNQKEVLIYHRKCIKTPKKESSGRRTSQEEEDLNEQNPERDSKEKENEERRQNKEQGQNVEGDPNLIEQSNSKESKQQGQTVQRKKSAIIGIESDKSQDNKQIDHIKIEQKNIIKKPSQNSNSQNCYPSFGQQTPENMEVSEEVYNHYKIKQLLDLTEKVKARLKDILNDLQKINIVEQVKIVSEEVEKIFNLLEICKKNTTKKLHKMMRIESQKKQAQEQNERLQKKLDAANHLFSSITSNSGDCSALTFEEHINEFIRHRVTNDFSVQRRQTQNNLELKPSSNREQIQVGVQTDVYGGIFLQSSVRRLFPDIRRILTTDEMGNSILNKSFIEDLQLLTSERVPHSLRIQKLESLVSEQQYINKTSPEKNLDEEGQYQDQKRSRIRLESQVRKLDSWIDHHKNEIVNLHQLLRKTASQERGLSEPTTPVRQNILQNERYMAQFLAAPKKEQKQCSEQQQNANEQEKTKIEELKDMFKSREVQFSTIILEKQQEITRLQAIVEKLSQNQLKQAKISPKESRNAENSNKDLEQLKSRFGDLQLNLEKQKTENERLRLEIKQGQLEQELLKIRMRQEFQQKISQLKLQSPKKQQCATLSIRVEEPVDSHQALSHQPEAPNTQNQEKQKESFNEEEKPIESRSEQKPKEVQNQQGEVQSDIHQPQVNEEQKQKRDLNPNKEKRFQRKSQIVERQPSPRSASNLDTNWKELVPQFFGKKKRK